MLKGEERQCRLEADRREVHHLDRAPLHRARAAHYAGDRPVRREALLARDQRIGVSFECLRHRRGTGVGFERLRRRRQVEPLGERGRHADPPWTDRPRRRERRDTLQQARGG